MPIEEDFILETEGQFDCSFEINANSTIWGNIEGDIENQTDLKNALDSKADNTEITELDGRLDTIEGTLPNLVPNTRTVNNKALSSDITLNYSDVGALASTTTINDLTTTAQQNALNSGANTTNIGQITTNTNAISLINGKIPTQASTTNQLADKNFVNSSIATNTANFIGTFNSVADLEAYSGTVTNNDYAFVISTDADGNTVYNRYKYNGDTEQWLFEYALNNSSFTAQQWASINSGVTSSDVTLIGTALQPNDNITELVNNAGYIQNTATGTDSLTVLGTAATNANCVNIGSGSGALSASTAVGVSSYASSNGTALGKSADCNSGLALGSYSKSSGSWAIAIGASNSNTDQCTASGSWAIAIGRKASATGNYAIQLGEGTNSTASTLQVGTYELLDLTTGLIPDARLSSNIPRMSDIPPGSIVDQTFTPTSANAQSGTAILPVLHSSKGYTESGQVYSDSTLYNDVLEQYNNSPFDLSKFTVVGTPTITSEGVASGFSSSNYIQNDNTITLVQTDDFELISPIFTPSATVSSQNTIISFYEDSNNSLGCRLDTTNRLWLLWKDTSGTDIIRNTTITYVNGQSYQVKFQRISTTYSIYYKIVGETDWTLVQSETSNADFYGTYYVKYGVSLNNNASPLEYGSLDLKTVSITIDGVEVFSGHKTGTLNYPAVHSYTVNGTLTNTNEVYSGTWSGTNNITISNNVDFTKTWTIKGKFLIGNLVSGRQQFLLNFNGAGNLQNGLWFTTATVNDEIVYRFTLGVSSYNTITSSDYIKWNTVFFEISYNGTNTYTLKIREHATDNWTTYTSAQTANVMQSNNVILIGYASYRSFEGSFDMKEFGLSNDGIPIQYPAFSIIYNIGTSGIYIADAIYRDDIKMASIISGNCNIASIDTTNQDVILPYGNIYGFINNSIQNNYTRIQGYDGTTTQTLKHVNGVLQWVSD